MQGLLTSAPAPGHADQLRAFAPMMGSWALVVEDIARDGTVETRDGEWHFDWALGGRAVVDVWISPARASRADVDDGEWGMSVRFWDDAIGRWRSIWHGPGRGWVIAFLGRRVGSEVHLEADHDGTPIRWRFRDITPTTFAWCAEHRRDGAWHVHQRFHATRDPTLAPPGADVPG